MIKFVRVSMLFVALCLVAVPATAQTEETSKVEGSNNAVATDTATDTDASPTAQPQAANKSLAYLGATLGCAGIMIGAGYGISRIGSAAVESMARQPEVAGNINTAMIVSAALIEGATFFALIVCLLSFIM